LLGAGSFAGGVFYSLKSDNFHDFFTEYIPFGEDAVLYLEEREFRRRFPNAFSRGTQPKVDAPQVKIPRTAGATWRISDGTEKEKETTDVGKLGPHISSKRAEEQHQERAAVVDSAKTIHPGQGSSVTPKTIEEKPLPKSQDTKQVEAVSKSDKSSSATLPATTADGKLTAINVDDVKDPVVQELAKVVNSIISAVNETGAQKPFVSAISAAKSELEHLSSQIGTIKSDMEKAAEQKLREKDEEFDKAAKDMMTDVQNQFGQLEQKWQEEFEDARAKLAEAYRERLQLELARSAQVNDQRLRNELLEQAIEMKKQWVNQIEDRVESERNGRLGKLKELDDAVAELEKLSASWTNIIDTNLKTQQVFAAIEAVRVAYESPAQPTPFLKEMAALKEIAEEDELVKAAIASINPLAYQRGVSTPSQLVDRFRKVSVEVRKAALLPEDAGVAGHASSWVLSKLLFKKQGLPQTQDVESILTRTETYLEEGDIDNAAREMNQLSGWARVLARDWLKEARLLLEVQQAVDVSP
jgi:mitofilin